jgi:CubicO group peptidase (beta-lactamase class C family)
MHLVLYYNTFSNQLNTHDELTDTLDKIRIQNNISAMAVAISSNGKVTYMKGFGYLDELGLKPKTKDSLFRITSISKLFTAQAVMRLIEDKKLGLNNNVGQYSSIFKVFFLPLNSYLSIKQLLTHSSGLSDSVRPVKFDDKRSE